MRAPAAADSKSMAGLGRSAVSRARGRAVARALSAPARRCEANIPLACRRRAGVTRISIATALLAARRCAAVRSLQQVLPHLLTGVEFPRVLLLIDTACLLDARVLPRHVDA